MKKKGEGTIHTTADLFRIINAQLKEQNLLPEHLDYALPAYQPTRVLADEWDCIGHINFGGSEGIYLDLYLHGYVGDDNPDNGDVHVGTYKTLRTDKEAYIDIGKLNAEFVFALKDFVRNHPDDFNWSGFTVSFYNGEDRKVTYYTDDAEAAVRLILRNTDKYDKAVVVNNYTKEETAVMCNEDIVQEKLLKKLK